MGIAIMAIICLHLIFSILVAAVVMPTSMRQLDKRIVNVWESTVAPQSQRLEILYSRTRFKEPHLSYPATSMMIKQNLTSSSD